MRFHVQRWNDRDKELTMLIMTEEMVENNSNAYVGGGYEILILPGKYKDKKSAYLETLRFLAKVRCGEVIYV